VSGHIASAAILARGPRLGVGALLPATTANASGSGPRWAASAELDDRTLTLHARDLPVESVELVRVTDLEPYIQGQRRLEEAWARHYAQEH
jgi:hypothetical protein